MKVRDLLEVAKTLDPDANVEVSVVVGSFPSGEEGAEDWIMSATIEKAEAIRGDLWIDVDYS